MEPGAVPTQLTPGYFKLDGTEVVVSLMGGGVGVGTRDTLT